MSQYRKEFEVIARAVIKCDDKILVCKNKGKGHYYLPGGHIELGEKAENALRREIKEELGISVGKTIFIGASENIFKDEKEHYEINLIFETFVDECVFESIESHIEFVLMDVKRFSKENILPVSLKEAVLGWIKNGKIFWTN